MFEKKFSVHHDPLGLTSFNVEIPKPDEKVDIDVAFKEFRRDVESIQFVYSYDEELSLEANWRILLNCRDWTLFWSARHPSRAVREQEKLSLGACNASIERIVRKARKHLERRLDLYREYARERP